MCIVLYSESDDASLTDTFAREDCETSEGFEADEINDELLQHESVDELLDDELGTAPLVHGEAEDHTVENEPDDLISCTIFSKYAVNIPWLLLDKASVPERQGEKGKPGRKYGCEYGRQ